MPRWWRTSRRSCAGTRRITSSRGACRRRRAAPGGVIGCRLVEHAGSEEDAGRGRNRRKGRPGDRVTGRAWLPGYSSSKAEGRSLPRQGPVRETAPGVDRAGIGGTEEDSNDSIWAAPSAAAASVGGRSPVGGQRVQFVQQLSLIHISEPTRL